MRRVILISLIAGLLLGMASVTVSLNAQDAAQPVEEEASTNYFMGILVFLVGAGLLWFLLHKMLYPYLLRFYHPTYCKNLFWSLFLLYGLAWSTIGVYILFDWGYRSDILKWVFVFIGIIWIIWFIIIMLKKEKAY